jgi:hypothetical protein
VLARNHVATSIYVCCKVRPINAAYAAIVIKENLRIQLEYQEVITRASSKVYCYLLNHHQPMAFYFPYQVEFRWDSPAIGDPVRNGNKPTRVYFHSP